MSFIKPADVFLAHEPYVSNENGRTVAMNTNIEYTPYEPPGVYHFLHIGICNVAKLEKRCLPERFSVEDVRVVCPVDQKKSQYISISATCGV